MSVFEELPSIFFEEMKAERRSEFAFLTDSSDVTVGIMSRPLRLLIRSSLMVLHWVVSNNVLACSNTVSKNISFIVFATSIMNFSVREINDNLEAMAKQLYDYWFVQFDFPNEEGKPYKSSGGAMVWNEKLKREIPQGWSVSNVKSLIEPIERGISYSSDDLLDPFATPMINLACFSKAGDYRLGEMKFFSGKVSNDKLISPMDMLIACTDMTQGADIIGRPILASDEYDQYTFSTDLALITPKGKLKMYLYYTLRTSFYHKYIRPFASGTTVKHLNLIGVENYGLPVPPIEIQSKFEDLITPIKEKQSKNLNEINALTKQRDELLPLLMNGQASVNSD